MLTQLGRIVAAARDKSGLWRVLFFALLALLVALNVVEKPHHPHIPEETLVGFWPAFALIGGVILIVLAKRVLTHFLAVDEDYYDR